MSSSQSKMKAGQALTQCPLRDAAAGFLAEQPGSSMASALYSYFSQTVFLELDS